MKIYRGLGFLLMLVFGCAEEERYPEITEDYCSVLTSKPLPSIFNYLPEDTSRSAVYSLEEGDMSMILRAWASESATKSIDIQYFIFSADNIGLIAVDHLLRAADRGVSVKILTNSLMSTDNLEAFNGYQRERDNLLDVGVDIFEFRPDAQVRYEVMQSALQKAMDYTPLFGLHAKSMVVDSEIAVIGTFNLDPRSANLNTECVTIIHDKTIAGRLERVMKKEMLPENAWHTTYDFNPDDEASWGKRFQLWLRGVVPESIL